jgi:OOP family OmpA-OmpF porin
MTFQRFLLPVIAASLLVGLVGCGGTTQFSGGQAFAIAGTPPPPPPPPPPPKVEPPKPPARVELRDNKIDFKEKIQFEVNKAIIKPESFGLLKEIGDVIKANPQVKKISIEGNASSEGNKEYNKKLSDDRAKSVMEYMVKKEGIDAARLTAHGNGADKPVADNATEEGREKNRRVDFLVTEQDVTSKKVEIDPATGKEKVVEEHKESINTAPPPPAPTTDTTKKPDTKKAPAAPAKPPATPAPGGKK